MNYSKYYEARDILQEILQKDLFGPLSENEVINEYPITYYVAGKLYPQDCNYAMDRSGAEDIGDIEEEQSISLDDGRMPSSMGISFALTDSATTLEVTVSAAQYVAEEKTDEQIDDKPDENTKNTSWKRKAIGPTDITVDVGLLCSNRRVDFEIVEGLKIVLQLHKEYSDGTRTISATLINSFEKSSRETRFWTNQHTFFQPQIRVSAPKDYFSDIRKNISISNNKDNQEMEMLYSKHRNYVTGHGCAADYSIEDSFITLTTSFIPVYELKQMMPSQNTKSKVLSMNYLASADKKDLITELRKWTEEYNTWITKNSSLIKTLKKEFHESATDNMNKCRKSYDIICKSIDSLNDEDVYRSFKYANEAMFLQRKRTLEQKGMNVNDEDIRWYPFQLAFFLQEIISFADPSSPERDNVDLLWFPTGGGKTEAYLGISAFVIFLRRFKHPDCGSGVSIIMRYTLRLLTFQQFERASALICACETLRKKYKIPGQEISIGLWAGKALTPNKIDMAQKILDGFLDPDNESSEPRQLEKCPWCGRPLEKENYSCDSLAQRMYVKCSNRNCDFKDGLPVHLIDEEIYRYRPTFLIATVDKFAQVAQREETFSLFGRGSNNIPPELIIQDELHLISGPLGTITGIYEAAFRKLCTNKNTRAKVIASTATIKNASEQIKALYGADFTQFPPQGIDADDSYFAVKSTKEDKASRLYMGCMGTGMSATSVMIRVMGAILYASRYLEMLGYDEDIIDSFWTITGYFNNLKELGGAIIRVIDYVQDRFGYLKETKLKDFYPIEGGQLRYDHYTELTSRVKSGNLGQIIQKDLPIKYTKNREAMPYDFILASNMISVGIDIARLNSMIVVGQPKTTAEYIQATSRVGRETPGFVFTIYNYSRSRDKSHFEQFCQYHDAFYKYVEATSVTPFAERSRDRALHTLYIILCRYYISELTDNKAAGRFSRDIPELKEVRNYILDYVNIVDPDEYENVLEELNEIEKEWENLANDNSKMTYRKDQFQKDTALYDEDYEEGSRFRVLNSMRSVETSVQVITRE